MPEENEVIKTITAEYEAKIAKMQADYDTKLTTALDEQNKRHIEQIKAILSGREEPKQKEPKQTDEEQLINNLRKKFNLKVKE